MRSSFSYCSEDVLRLTLDTVLLEILRHVLRPQDRDVRLGRRTQIGQSVQHAIAAFGHERLSVQAHSGDALRRPVRISAEQRVVFRRAQKTHDPKFLHELIPQFLRARFVQNFFPQVALNIDVEECRNPTDRHRGAVRFLHRA